MIFDRSWLAPAKPRIVRSALLAMHASGVHRLAPAALAGCGVIFMLHRVREAEHPGFAPNRILEVTPGFLDAVISRVKELGYVCISLDEAARRLKTGNLSDRFAVFTLDDGYRDNLTQAAPIFERHAVPFTLYLSTGLPDGTAELWWVALERIFAKARRLRIRFCEGEKSFDLETDDKKTSVWSAIYWRLRSMPENLLRCEIRRLAEQHGIDIAGITRELALSWDEVRSLASSPLASIEAHTADHFALARRPPEKAREDIAKGIARHTEELGSAPRHFSYPYGDASAAGPRDYELAEEFHFRSATTTRKGLIHPTDAGHLMSLPRLSLNGDYQDIRMVEVLLSGLPFALTRN